MPQDENAKHKKGRSLSWKAFINWVICGYIVGVALTVLWYSYCTERTLSNANTWITCMVLVLLIMLISHSRSLRCTIAVAIPTLCSSKGRSLIVATAFVLAATGPTMNILANVDVLANSLSCGQTELKEALGKMLEVIKQPLAAVKDAISKMLNKLRIIVQRVQHILFRIKELIMVVLASIKNAFNWLGSVVQMCNKTLGTPYERCSRLAEEAMEECRKSLGVVNFLCQMTKILNVLCQPAKIGDYLCKLVDFISDAVVEVILKRLRHFTKEVQNLFDVSVTFDHDFYFNTTASKSFSEVSQEILDEIHLRWRNFAFVFGWLELVSSFLLIGVLFKVLYFKTKYLKSPGYNNKYIAADFIEINESRKRKGQELALPLTKTERRKYIKLSDWLLTRSEALRMARSMLFLAISSTQLICICLCDYGLYWLLAIISYYGHKEAGIEVPPFIAVDVRGGGLVGQIFSGIAEAFEPFTQSYAIDSTPCLPKPFIPNFKRYLEIIGLCLLAWLFLIAEPYGLRLRHIAMRFYYPEAARERATWLYNEILMKRMSFFKLARRKARAKFLNDTSVDDFTFLDWLRVKLSWCFLCRWILGKRKAICCIICSTPLNRDKVQCVTVGCKGLYCHSCYAESRNICCLCKNPIDYGDDSDMSYVKDSSDEAVEVRVCETCNFCKD